jgi:hypothetical protein
VRRAADNTTPARFERDWNPSEAPPPDVRHIRELLVAAVRAIRRVVNARQKMISVSVGQR